MYPVKYAIVCVFQMFLLEFTDWLKTLKYLDLKGFWLRTFNYSSRVKCINLAYSPLKQKKCVASSKQPKVLQQTFLPVSPQGYDFTVLADETKVGEWGWWWRHTRWAHVKWQLNVRAVDPDCGLLQVPSVALSSRGASTRSHWLWPRPAGGWHYVTVLLHNRAVAKLSPVCIVGLF